VIFLSVNVALFLEFIFSSVLLMTMPTLADIMLLSLLVKMNIRLS